MKIVLFLIFTYADEPIIERVHGFSNMQLCEIAGQKILSAKGILRRYSDYKCIVIDNNNVVEKE
jgi:hypothetical protein